ncbi:unnamed protein product, partial [Choristocarpus tenellus]
GSKSAAKIAAVREAFLLVFPDHEVDIVGSITVSGVPDQPIGDDTTKAGAINRARAASLAYATDHNGAIPSFAVGLEERTTDDACPAKEVTGATTASSMYCFAWAAVLSSAGEWGLSRTGSFTVDKRVADLVSHQGIELGLACDQVFSTAEGKGQGGLVGIVTKGLITRTSFYSHALVLALAPHTSHGYH